MLNSQGHAGLCISTETKQRREGVHLHVVFLHPSSFVSPALTPPTPHLPLCLTLLGYHPVGRQCARGSVQC